nr:TIGR03086 family metal-binding protein [Glutamicibacter sp. 0426]
MAALQLVLHHLQEKDLQRPTPCTEFNVSQLVDHLAGNLALACKAMGSEQADDPSLAPEPRIAQLAQAALESFSARGLEGTLDLGFAEVPASVLSGILNLESMVHGWDFAQATSQEFDVDPGLAEYVLELARATVGEQQRASGSLGPETAIAESAGSLERLIAFTGRVPAGARAAPMVDAATSIVIRRPLHEVAGSTMDPLNAPVWYRNISTARRLDEGNFGIGARAAFEARFRGRALSYTYVFKEYVPGRLLVMATAQGPFPMRTSYRFKAVDGARTRVHLRNDGRPSGFSKLLAPLMAPDDAPGEDRRSADAQARPGGRTTLSQAGDADVFLLRSIPALRR